MEQQLILDRYRPLDELGEGAFGSVTLAWDTRMQRRVAIKRLPLPLDERGLPHQPHGLTEARTAAMLGHPSIVTVYDFDTDSDEAFIVMEFVDGSSLADLLEHIGGPLTLDESATLIADVSAALAFAHDNGVLHLDIKPENVLVTRDGRAKVADFGMAELSSLSGHGPAFGGTPGYMPPEQLRGDTVTERTDEWALAALAYEILTGDNPFTDPALSQSAERLQAFEPQAPSAVERELGAGVDNVLLAALDPSADERYESVTGFFQALGPYLGDTVAGRASLAEIVSAYAEEEPDEEPGLRSIGAWDRLSGPVGRGLVRIAAAAESAWLAWAGLVPFALERPALIGAVALVGVAGALAPGLGIGLGMGCLAVGMFAAGVWPVGVALLVVGGSWWWFAARHDTGAAVLPLAAPTLGVARLGLLQPLLAGFALAPLLAAVTALLGAALTMLASAASAQGPPYLAVWPGYALDVWNAELAGSSVRMLVASPAAYVALLSWPAAAAAMSALCARATRTGAALGTLAAAALLGGGYLLAGRVAALTSTPTGWTGEPLAIALGAAFGVMVLVVSLGPPLRPEEE